MTTVPSPSQLRASAADPLLISSRSNAPKPGAFASFTHLSVLPGVSLVRVVPDPLLTVGSARLYIASYGACWTEVGVYDKTYGSLVVPGGVSDPGIVTGVSNLAGNDTIDVTGIVVTGRVGYRYHTTGGATEVVDTVVSSTQFVASESTPIAVVGEAIWFDQESSRVWIEPPEPIVFTFDFSLATTGLYISGHAGVHVFGSPLLTLDGSSMMDRELARRAAAGQVT